MTIEEDPIVAEVREARRRIAVFYGNDIRRIAMAARQSFAEMAGLGANVDGGGGRISESREANFGAAYEHEGSYA